MDCCPVSSEAHNNHTECIVMASYMAVQRPGSRQMECRPPSCSGLQPHHVQDTPRRGEALSACERLDEVRLFDQGSTHSPS